MQIQLESPSENGWAAEIARDKHKTSNVIQEDIIETEVVSVHENIIAIIGALFFFSICGVLVRIGLNQLENYDGQPVHAIMYAQFVGCIFIGFLLEYKIRIESQYHTLFVGLSTGLCGSMTSFSGVMLAATREFYNMKEKNRDTFHSILGGFAVYLIGFGMSFVGFCMGRHAAMAILEPHLIEKLRLIKIKYMTAKLLSKATVNRVDVLFLILGVACYAMTIALVCSVQGGREITFSMLFAPFGTLLRWKLGKINPKYPKFPLGTFIANGLGSYILTVVYILGISVVSSEIGCDIMIGLMDGFCGCLTTISSWIVEVTGLELKPAYKYASISIIVAQVGLALGFGIYVGKGTTSYHYCSSIV